MKKVKPTAEEQEKLLTEKQKVKRGTVLVKKENRKKIYPRVDTIVHATGEVISKPAIKTPLTYHLFPQELEFNLQESETKENQTITVVEMLKRHRAGMPVYASKGALYKDDEELIQDLDKMDLIDRQAYVDSVAERIAELKGKMKAEADTEAKKKFLDAVDLEVKKELARIRANEQTGSTDNSLNDQK